MLPEAEDPERRGVYWRVGNNRRQYLSGLFGEWHDERMIPTWLASNSTLERIVMWVNLGWEPPNE